MSTTAILAMVLLALVVGVLVGHVFGERRGRDAQWVDDFIEAGRRDAARRDSLGQFKEVRK